MQNGEAYDLSQITDAEGVALCAKLRSELIETVSHTGGHLASNLGAVEILVALHRVFHTEKDRLVFDVGHQCYVHKMLTGRADKMNTLRTFGGLSGFPKPEESIHDAFIAGHASNSVSVAIGMARARTLLGEDYNVIALLGDGALTGGLAYEGLSDAGSSGEHLLVILNDNGMSISKNVGGIARLLARHHLKPQYLALKRAYRNFGQSIPGGQSIYRFTANVKQMVKGALLPSSFFEDMGFTYLGPVDGHDLAELTRLMKWAKDEVSGPVLLHVRTTKGKGYLPAERTPDLFHGVAPFDAATGKPLKPAAPCFSQVAGETLTELAAKNRRVCAVTAAMENGTGLVRFAELFPDRFFDVGIAEEHAVTMCAGMAKQGMLPVFCVYSTFLQRAFDQLMHDVALQHLHVVLCVDRAGLVGDDGDTHQGIFDLSMLSTVPGITVLTPASFAELRSMLRRAVLELDGPVAIRYPRGGEGRYQADTSEKTGLVLEEGSDVTLVAYGTMISEAQEAARLLVNEGIAAEIVKLNQVVPLDSAPILASVRKTGRLVICEETTMPNSVGQFIAAQIAQSGVLSCKVKLLNCGFGFVTHGTVPQLRDMLGIDGAHIAAAVKEMVRNG